MQMPDGATLIGPTDMPELCWASSDRELRGPDKALAAIRRFARWRYAYRAYGYAGVMLGTIRREIAWAG